MTRLAATRRAQTRLGIALVTPLMILVVLFFLVPARQRRLLRVRRLQRHQSESRVRRIRELHRAVPGSESVAGAEEQRDLDRHRHDRAAGDRAHPRAADVERRPGRRPLPSRVLPPVHPPAGRRRRRLGLDLRPGPRLAQSGARGRGSGLPPHRMARQSRHRSLRRARHRHLGDLGFIFVILLAALRNVDTELVDASRLDGANTVQRLWYIILPQIMPVFLMVTTITLVGGFSVFDIIFVMTGGGPAGATDVLGTFAYSERIPAQPHQLRHHDRTGHHGAGHPVRGLAEPPPTTALSAGNGRMTIQDEHGFPARESGAHRQARPSDRALAARALPDHPHGLDGAQDRRRRDGQPVRAVLVVLLRELRGRMDRGQLRRLRAEQLPALGAEHDPGGRPVDHGRLRLRPAALPRARHRVLPGDARACSCRSSPT